MHCKANLFTHFVQANISIVTFSNSSNTMHTGYWIAILNILFSFSNKILEYYVACLAFLPSLGQVPFECSFSFSHWKIKQPVNF